MNLRLSIAEVHIPRRVRRRELLRLFALTARAFGNETPRFDGLSYAGILREYAGFTAACAERSLAGGVSPMDVVKRLHDSAFVYGQELRCSLRLKSRTDVVRAARLLYRLLGIDLNWSSAGGIVVQKCFFAGFYTAGTCGLISALDAGILTGLAGGGRLEFTERITENRPVCRARFDFPADMP